MCPRCKSQEFKPEFLDDGHCWWCSQFGKTAVCAGPKGCGMRLCRSCFGRAVRPAEKPPAVETPVQKMIQVIGEEDFQV